MLLHVALDLMDITGQEHPVGLVGHARAGPDIHQDMPGVRCKSCLLGQLASRGLPRRLARDVQQAGGQLLKAVPHGVSVLPDHEDPVSPVEGNHPDRTGMNDDVTLAAGAARHGHDVLADADDPSLVTGLRADDVVEVLGHKASSQAQHTRRRGCRPRP